MQQELSVYIENKEELENMLKEKYGLYISDTFIKEIVYDVIKNAKIYAAPQADVSIQNECVGFIKGLILKHPETFNSDTNVIESTNNVENVDNFVDNPEKIWDVNNFTPQITPHIISSSNNTINTRANFNVPYNILREFIVKMQASTWKDKRYIQTCNSAIYLIICSALGIIYTDFKTKYKTTLDGFEDNKILFKLAKFYVYAEDGIKNPNVGTDKISGKFMRFTEILSDAYDSILDTNIKEFILKPLGLPDDKEMLKQMKEYIIATGDKEYSDYISKAHNKTLHS